MSTPAQPAQNFQRGNKGDTNANEKERGKDVRSSNIAATKGKIIDFLVIQLFHHHRVYTTITDEPILDYSFG